MFLREAMNRSVPSFYYRSILRVDIIDSVFHRNLMALLMGFCVLLTSHCTGEEGQAATGDSVVEARLRELDTEMKSLGEQEQQAQADWLAKRRMATDAERRWQSMLGELEQIALQQRDLEQTLKAKQKERDETSAKVKEAMAATAAARKAFEEAKKRLEEAEKNEQKLSAMVEAAAKPIDELSTQLAALAEKVEPLKSSAAKAKDEAAPVQRDVLAAEQRWQEIVSTRRKQQQAIESFMRQSGQWVSFSDEISPIFHQRCVACHNARNSQGRYNMATYNAIHAVGESGHAIVPGDPDASRLVQMIEDGSMPYDADPLSDEQIALVRRWVELGARVDSSADPDSPLVRLLPRVAQPLPPTTYRAALPISALAVHSDGKGLASSGYHELLIWSAESGELIRRITNVAQRVYGLAMHPDGRRLAVACGTPGQIGEVKLFDLNSGELLKAPIVSEEVFFDVAFAPDGKQLAAAAADGTIALIPIDQSTEAIRYIEDHSDWVHSIAWSADSQRLVSASRDKTAKVFDAGSGKLVITFNGHGQSVTTACFTADSSHVVSGGNDGRLRVWSVSEAKEVRSIKLGTTEFVDLQLLGKDRLVSAGADGRVRIHQWQDGKKLSELRAPGRWISGLAMDKNEQTLFCGDQAGKIHRISIDKDLVLEKSWLATPK